MAPSRKKGPSRSNGSRRNGPSRSNGGSLGTGVGLTAWMVAGVGVPWYTGVTGCPYPCLLQTKTLISNDILFLYVSNLLISVDFYQKLAAYP